MKLHCQHPQVFVVVYQFVLEKSLLFYISLVIGMVQIWTLLSASVSENIEVKWESTIMFMIIVLDTMEPHLSGHLRSQTDCLDN